jgi:hypothetical protein
MPTSHWIRAGYLAVLVTLGVASHADEPKAFDSAEVQATKAYLRIKYDELIRKHGLVTGLAYIEADLAPLKVSDAPRFLPRTTFYRTKLANDAMEYYSVDLLVAVTPDGGGYDIRSCTSPLFAEPSAKFLQLFRQIRVSSVADRRKVAVAIGQLFASVISGAVQDLGPAAGGGDPTAVYKARLLHRDRPWRDVAVTFDEQGWVKTVQLAQPNATPN